MSRLNRYLRGLYRQLQRQTEVGSLTADEHEFLRDIFVPHHYAREAGLRIRSSQKLFKHYLRDGLRLNLSPTPLFDAEEFSRSVPDASRSRVPDILSWYRQHRSLSASPYFDPGFYRILYPDVDAENVAPFEHYLRFGAKEERRPNQIFDPQWYSSVADRRPGEERLPGFVHFLLFGIERGGAPSAGLLPVFCRTPAAANDSAAALKRVHRAIQPWTEELSAEQIQTLFQLFNPDIYTGGIECGEEASGLSKLEHFLSSGASAGLDPSPLFEGDFYAKRARLRKSDQSNRLLHFLKVGAARRLVPTSLFDEKAYENAWPDIRESKVWGFAHFISHGLYEGRRIDGSERVGAYSVPATSSGGQFYNWRLFWEEAGFPSDARPVLVESRHSPARPVSQTVADADLPLVRGLFVPSYYAEQADLDREASPETLFDHYLKVGSLRDLAPGPLFDPRVARALVRGGSGPALHQWLAHRSSALAAPTPYFDVQFYASYYPEFQGVAFDLFEHYIKHGLWENRAPNFAFDPSWYAQAYNHRVEERETPAFLHFLLHGAKRGLAPSRLLLTTFDQSFREFDGWAAYLSVCRAGAPWVEKLGAQAAQAMLAMFCPYTYDGGGELPQEASGPARLVHFLEKGIRAGLTPSPLFDPKLHHSGGLSIGEPPLINYLRKGWPRREVPTSIFSEQSYLSAHGDIREHKIWGFRHFLFHGVFEGRKTGGPPQLTLSPVQDDLAGGERSNARMFWAAHAETSMPLPMHSGILAAQRRIASVFKSQTLEDTLNRALAIEPAIGDIRSVQGHYAPPFHDPAASTMRKLHDRIPDKAYASVICVPWLRVGGADLVACQLADALRRAYPNEEVLILRVDYSNFDVPEWVPKSVDTVDISDVLAGTAQDVSERLLFTLIQALQLKRVINVNSLRTWRMFERFGTRLQPYVNLYAYMFCWDQTPAGHRTGYPSMFYPSTAGIIAGVFLDTDYLRNELLRIYRPPQSVAKRTITLHSPSRSEVPKVACARLSLQTRRGRRARVLWAGRLDRQKRFDLVEQIAAKMPHVDFLCWGNAVLDTPAERRASPRNLILKPGFEDYAELPFDDADVWLFTSAWEGMPTILIEVAIRGMAVVASEVGGVPELITDKTGYPVCDVNSVDAYVAAIQDCLGDPEGRVMRAERLMKTASEKYSIGNFVRELKAVFEEER